MFIPDNAEYLNKLVRTYRQLQGYPWVFRDFTLEKDPFSNQKDNLPLDNLVLVSEYKVDGLKTALKIRLDHKNGPYDPVRCCFYDSADPDRMETTGETEFPTTMGNIGLACEKAFMDFSDSIRMSIFHGTSKFLPDIPCNYDWFEICRKIQKLDIMKSNFRSLFAYGKVEAESIGGPCVFALLRHLAVLIPNNNAKETNAYKYRNIQYLLLLENGEFDIVKMPWTPDDTSREILSAVEKTNPIDHMPPLKITNNIAYDIHTNGFIAASFPEEENAPEPIPGASLPHPA